MLGKTVKVVVFSGIGISACAVALTKTVRAKMNIVKFFITLSLKNEAI
jgi:hypothetical protein